MKGAPKIRAVGSDERPSDGQSKASAKRPRLTGADAQARAEVLRLFSSGEQPEAIAKQLALRLDHVNRHIKSGMERVVAEYAKASPQKLFARFALSQVELARRLRDAEDVLGIGIADEMRVERLAMAGDAVERVEVRLEEI